MTTAELADRHLAKARALEAQARAMLDEAHLLRQTVDALTLTADGRTRTGDLLITNQRGTCVVSTA